MSKRRAGGDDVIVGNNIRVHRLARKMSQTALADQIGIRFQQVQKYEKGANRVGAGRLVRIADALGLTFQQVQKYEKGANRISAGRLQRIAEVLGVPVAFFFAAPASDKETSGAGADHGGFLQTEGALRLARAYARIKEPGIRLQLLRLTEAIAEE